jgi:AraC-like DNA-binding protein
MKLIDTATLLEGLYSFSELEEKLYDYYKRTGHLVSEEKFSEYISKYPSNELRQIFRTSPDTLPRSNEDPLSLKETALFDSELDIFMLRHPRYAVNNMHNHKFFEIEYVLDGSCTQNIPVHGDIETHKLNSGDFIFIPPGQNHSVLVDTNSIILNIGIRSGTFIEAFMSNIPNDSILGNYFTHIMYYDRKTNYLIFHTGGSKPLQHMVTDMALTYCNRNTYSRNLMNLQLSILFIHLLQDYSGSIEFSFDAVETAHNIPAIILYMEKNYVSTNVAAIAEHFGYSSDHLNRVFKHYTSHTLYESLLKIRMQNACRLINDTYLPISEIAHLVGYKDTTNFIRNFKKSYGITPSKYKERNM